MSSRHAAPLMAVGLVVLALGAFPNGRAGVDPGHARLPRRCRASLDLHAAGEHRWPDLRAFPYDFLYGSIAADTSIAKKYAAVGRHSHSWAVGFDILDRARDDALKAFSYGYLAHLAADVVAHNAFVPYQLGDHLEHDGSRPQLLGNALRDAPGRMGAAPRARADPAGSQPERRAPRPDPEPDDFQHADQPADFSRHGRRRRHGVVAARVPVDARAQPMGPRRRPGLESPDDGVRLHHGPPDPARLFGSDGVRSVRARPTADGQAHPSGRAARGRRRRRRRARASSLRPARGDRAAIATTGARRFSRRFRSAIPPRARPRKAACCVMDQRWQCASDIATASLYHVLLCAASRSAMPDESAPMRGVHNR